MPLKLDKNIRANDVLIKENIFAMDAKRASSQDIRPLRVAILNLMPQKEVAEKQLLRLLSNTPLQIEVVFLRTDTYTATTSDTDYLQNFYQTFEQVKKQKQKFDALIVTGAPVEKLEFKNVDYWQELTKILDWAAKNVYSSLYICWAAQAAIFYHYGIKKYEVDNKIFGLFNHSIPDPLNPLVRGFDNCFVAPHSRHTDIDKNLVINHKDLDALAISDEAGLYLAASKDLRRVFVFGHGEYDADTLHQEYTRDKQKGLKIELPKNYYINNKEGSIPPITWRSHQQLLIQNWLNYCVYQATPFNLENI